MIFIKFMYNHCVIIKPNKLINKLFCIKSHFLNNIVNKNYFEKNQYKSDNDH